MKLNEKIYTCRKKAGLSQDELAEKLGVSRQAISKWELGMAQPELDNLLILARTFGVTTDWLLTDDESNDTKESSTSFESTTEPKSEPSSEPPPRFSGENVNTYPAWLDNLPHTLGSICKRFGWLVGVYISVIGSFFAGFGILGRVIVSFMFRNTAVDTKTTTSADNFIIGGDELPDEVMDELYEQFAGSSGGFISDPFGGMFEQYEQEVENLAQNNPVTIICNVLIVVGVVFIILGIVTAVLLRRYAKKNV